MNVIVFSPHQDDEAFSCAGTIARHVQSGDEVTIVFATDGRLGFNPAIEGKYTQDELASLRHDEALAAAEAMGVPSSSVTFLEYRDQDLGNPAHHDAAVARIQAILIETKPGIVYIAITNYGHVDHQALYLLTFDALVAARYDGEVRVSIPHGIIDAGRPARGPVVERIALVDKAFPSKGEIKVDITTTLYRKLAAIKAHESQLGMFANLVDPADDFNAAMEEIFLDVYHDKIETFESRFRSKR
jgi:LmbE family N-acetylglucosaminyl deacetylase